MGTAACAILIGWFGLAQAPAGTMPDVASGSPAAESAPAAASGAKAKPLQAALVAANAAVRRGKVGEDAPEKVALAELDGALTCDVTINTIETLDSGEKIARATLLTSRAVSVQSKAGDEAIRSAASGVTAAREAGDRALREFEKSWEPVKSDPRKYIRTHWGGCRRYWPRITAAEYQNRRNALIEKNQASIASAKESLDATRERVRTETNSIIQAAKTVQAVFKISRDAASGAELAEGKRARLTFRVDKVDVGMDPETVRHASAYVTSVHGTVVEAAALGGGTPRREIAAKK